jgi:hypothetical protein
LALRSVAEIAVLGVVIESVVEGRPRSLGSFQLFIDAEHRLDAV